MQNRCSEGEMVGFLGANDLLGEIFSASWDRNDNSLRLTEMIHHGESRWRNSHVLVCHDGATPKRWLSKGP